MIVINGKCPVCGKMRTLFYARLENGLCEARAQCWRCDVDEVHTAGSMDDFVIEADVQEAAPGGGEEAQHAGDDSGGVLEADETGRDAQADR